MRTKAASASPPIAWHCWPAGRQRPHWELALREEKVGLGGGGLVSFWQLSSKQKDEMKLQSTVSKEDLDCVPYGHLKCIIFN